MAGIALPSGAAGVTPTATVTKEGEELQVAEKSFSERMMEIPSALKDAYTGEGQEVEFPDVPEASNMGGDAPSLVEGILPNIKTFFARDDVGKTEILENAFSEDERWGGRFQDKFGNPMIVWNKKPYYMNKPGFSGTDFGTFVGETIKAAPAMLMSGGASVLGTIAKGVPLYSGTEAGSQVLEAAMTPVTTKAKKETMGDQAAEIATATALGVGADVLLPPMLKGAGKVITAPLKAGARVASTLPSLPQSVRSGLSGVVSRMNAAPQTSTYDLSTGQRAGPAPDTKQAQLSALATEQIETEDMLRRAASTGKDATIIMRGFDELQMDQIRADAAALQSEFGSGNPQITQLSDDVGDAAATDIQKIVSARADTLSSQASDAFDAVRTATDAPKLTPEGLAEIANNAVAMIRAETGPAMRNQMPAVQKYLKKMNQLVKIGNNPKAKPVSLATIKDFQEALNIDITKALGPSGIPAEGRVLTMMKNDLNAAFNSAIEKGLMTGDQTVLDQLAQSRALYTQFMGLTGKQSGKDKSINAANKILEMITNPSSVDPSSGYTSRQVVGALFGHAKFAPAQTVPIVVNKLKSILPEEEADQVIRLMKDAVLERAFSGSGKSGVTRTNIVNNYQDIFGKNSNVVNALFAPEEIARISKFRENVLPTMWAEIKLNPSGSAYTGVNAMVRSGLMNAINKLPFVGRELALGLEEGANRSAALEATRSYLRRANAPLLSGTFQSATRPEIVETMTSDESPSAQSILKSLPPEIAEKVRQAAQAAQ